MRPTLWLQAAVAAILGMAAVGAAWGAATPEDALEEVRAAIAEGRYEEAASAASGNGPIGLHHLGAGRL